MARAPKAGSGALIVPLALLATCGWIANKCGCVDSPAHDPSPASSPVEHHEEARPAVAPPSPPPMEPPETKAEREAAPHKKRSGHKRRSAKHEAKPDAIEVQTDVGHKTADPFAVPKPKPKDPPSEADAMLREADRNMAKRKATARRSCCKICRTGIPCGNSCISAGKACHQPPGCAC